ncbi:SWIM zinc finger family protein [Oscillochloris sp. ZM17-4]|uniref:SWIM zinc finger family protein n=1 Tax=Oscillochloris sp. ZM17-4 TaxID=2866714 RepID=UPI001C72CBE0|nr:SWIM zinc finger family protein [Oscillochloris sp. ZM17-4]MBX0330995.1 SWIM zinc finger family protein [Oscillochloris sp. ZM17-4]
MPRPRRKGSSSSRHTDSWPERRPRIPANGIKAKSQRGEFGETWWARRWIEVLEGFGFGTRLTRGRSYARNGSVLNIDIAPGHVSARVQGSQRAPYKVTIATIPLSNAQWAKVIDAMSEQAIFSAKLLAGEMPREIEEAFAAARVSLFPTHAGDLETSCSCPDFANPCKHIAAVYFLLGERFDEDPFLIFALRGRSKDQIIAALRARRAAAAEPVSAPVSTVEPVPALASQLDSFDALGPELAALTSHIAIPEVETALLLRYGPPPADSELALRNIYRAISRAAIERIFQEEDEEA